MRSRRTAAERLLSSRTVRLSRGEEATVASTRSASPPGRPGPGCGLAAGYALRYWLTTNADAAVTAASSTRSAGWSAGPAWSPSAGRGRSSFRSPMRSYPESARAVMSSSARSLAQASRLAGIVGLQKFLCRCEGLRLQPDRTDEEAQRTPHGLVVIHDVDLGDEWLHGETPLTAGRWK